MSGSRIRARDCNGLPGARDCRFSHNASHSTLHAQPRSPNRIQNAQEPALVAIPEHGCPLALFLMPKITLSRLRNGTMGSTKTGTTRFFEMFVSIFIHAR